MEVNVIKDEKGYRAALNRFEELMGMDFAEGSVEDREFDLLALVLKDYESSKFDIGLPDPVSAIEFRMDQAGLKPRDLEPFIGSKSKVSEVLNRKRNLTLSMMRGLHKGLGIPLEVLMQEPVDPLMEELDFSKFPIAEMVKRHWFCNFRGNASEASENASRLIKDFLAPVGGEVWHQALHRKSDVRSGRNMNEYALAAWHVRVLTKAQKQKLAGKFREGSIDPSFLRDAAVLSRFSDGPKIVREFLSENGIALVFERQLPRTYLDGAALKTNEGLPVIAMTLRYDRIDNFWFVLIHELAHVMLHLRDRFVVFDDLAAGPGDSDIELEADEAAERGLIPEEYWGAVSAANGVSEVKELAREIKVHPAVVAGRKRFETKNYKLFSRLVGQGQIRRVLEEAV